MKTILGWLVIVVDIGQFLPQAFRTVSLRRDRNALRGLSLWTWTIATIQAALWIYYGLRSNRLPIALPNIVIAPTCLLILVLAIRARRRDNPAVAA
jgi:uncharacterized protein with PQ loop repeat